MRGGRDARALVARLEAVLVECQRLAVEPGPPGDRRQALRRRQLEAARLLAELEVLVPPARRSPLAA